MEVADVFCSRRAAGAPLKNRTQSIATLAGRHWPLLTTVQRRAARARPPPPRYRRCSEARDECGLVAVQRAQILCIEGIARAAQERNLGYRPIVGTHDARVVIAPNGIEDAEQEVKR